MEREHKKRYTEFSADIVRKRVEEMKRRRQKLAQDVEGLHVKLSYNNSKTGALVPSVSLIPVEDCVNCGQCCRGCYDVRNVCHRSSVQESRANNSAIYHADPKRYFIEIDAACKFLRFFRWHVGGDILNTEYLENVVRIAEQNPHCSFIIFTKAFVIVNNWLNTGGMVPGNLQLIFSDWSGLEMANPFGLPVASPVWTDKEGNETRGSHCTERCTWCGDDCTECARTNSGCWSARNGDTILFKAH